MLEIDNTGAWIGMGIAVITLIIFYFLAEKSRPKRKNFPTDASKSKK